MAFYDENGEPVEALSQEEVDAKIEERLNEAKEKGLLLTDEQKEEIEKLKTKDFNFRALEEKVKAKTGEADAETEEKKEELSQKEAELEARLKAIEESNKTFAEKQALSWEEKAFSRINPDNDEKLTEKIKHIMDTKLAGVKPQTEAEYLELVVDASKLLPEDTANPVLTANAIGGHSRDGKVSYADTAEGKEKAKKIGLAYINEQK